MWKYDPSMYEENSYTIVPAGDHRARVEEVEFKTSKSSGKEMFEITLAISGFSSKVWHYLVLDPADPKKTNQRIGVFLESFGITDHDMSHYRGWIGKVGAVKIAHEDYQGNTSAKVRYCLSRKNQEKLPPAKFNDNTNATPSGYAEVDVPVDELPFF